MPEKEPQFFGTEGLPGGMPERVPAPPEKEPIKSLKEFIRLKSLEMKEGGIPVDERGRINPDKFKGVYPRATLEADRKYIKEHKEVFQRADAAGKERLSSLFKGKTPEEKGQGDICEMLTTAVLQKNLKENFIVVRSSEFDDIRYGADTIILDKKTGNIVCAIDEIGRTAGTRYEDKKQRILEKNLKGGGFLKYGIYFEENKKGEPELKKGPVSNIPLFYCALSENLAQNALQGFQQSEESSPDEKKLFSHFLSCSREQIDLLKEERLHPKLKERMELFEESVLK